MTKLDVFSQAMDVLIDVMIQRALDGRKKQYVINYTPDLNRIMDLIENPPYVETFEILSKPKLATMGENRTYAVEVNPCHCIGKGVSDLYNSSETRLYRKFFFLDFNDKRYYVGGYFNKN